MAKENGRTSNRVKSKSRSLQVNYVDYDVSLCSLKIITLVKALPTCYTITYSIRLYLHVDQALLSTYLFQMKFASLIQHVLSRVRIVLVQGCLFRKDVLELLIHL